MQLGVERLGSQMENNSLRQQLGLANLAARAQGQGPKPLTINEKLALKKDADAVFGNPASPEFQQYVGAAYTGGPKQLALDLKNKRVTMDELQKSINQAKRTYTQNFLGGTRSSSGATSYDQAESDLLGR